MKRAARSWPLLAHGRRDCFRRPYTKAVFELTAIDDAETVADHVR
jgi:hypothetical protein